MRPFATEILAAFITLSVLFAPLVRADDGEIRVEAITPALRNDTLTVSAQFKNLFSEKIVGTIQSGLPCIVKIEVELRENGEKKTLEREVTRTIEYDVWSERYSVRRSDSTDVLSDFEKVKQSIRQFQHDLAATASLKTNSRYTIAIRAAIIPITTRQADKISDWLLDPNQTEESLPSQNRSSGFKMNLNKLVSFLVGSKRRSRYSSDWYTSNKFNIEELEQ